MVVAPQNHSRVGELAERQQIRPAIAAGEEWRSMATMRAAFVAEPRFIGHAKAEAERTEAIPAGILPSVQGPM
jgi:hypothetical protein